jgi:hypothetical protein
MPPVTAAATGAQLDEELARHALLGTLVHRAIAELLQTTRAGTLSDPLTYRSALTAADRVLAAVPSIEARAHRQRIAAAIYTYLTWLIPPAPWLLSTTELPIGVNRVDLAWADPAGRILIDEVKTGRLGIGLTATGLQITEYLKAGSHQFGDAFLGIRVVSTGDPTRSWLQPPRGRPVPLARTGYLAHPRSWAPRRPYPSMAGRPIRGARAPPTRQPGDQPRRECAVIAGLTGRPHGPRPCSPPRPPPRGHPRQIPAQLHGHDPMRSATRSSPD